MSAQENAIKATQEFVGKVNDVIIFPIITLLLAVAFFLFLYGCVEYIVNAANSSKRAEGVKHITWGIIGLVVMLSAWAILQVAAGTFGLGEQLDCARTPNASGCTELFKFENEP